MADSEQIHTEEVITLRHINFLFIIVLFFRSYVLSCHTSAWLKSIAEHDIILIVFKIKFIKVKLTVFFTYKYSLADVDFLHFINNVGEKLIYKCGCTMEEIDFLLNFLRCSVIKEKVERFSCWNYSLTVYILKFLSHCHTCIRRKILSAAIAVKVTVKPFPSKEATL